ncbi:(E,E)-geranyllinalool synthase-like [Cornus florida]|uniref:(E,E)-geranyllinalool synthase-like n=1 Tax=Cornus florida TaxID=4283 RepID=UPI002896B688|nr:(E,E)-geranyllinalool synthase-like [Cornus florida]
MESSVPTSPQTLVNEIKEDMFSTSSSTNSIDVYSFVSPSAYDTAWLAMIPDPEQRDCPMFKGCLDWVLDNQRDEGFWGEDQYTIDTLLATLVCMVVLKTWNVGDKNIKKGLEFIHSTMEMLLIKVKQDGYPRWFSIVFPGIVELSQAKGLENVFPDELKGEVLEVFFHRQRILDIIYIISDMYASFCREELVDKYNYPPLLSYLEALPSTYDIDQEDIVMHSNESDGSLFQSPSATACAYMTTGNQKCMDYLVSLVQTCGHGVPSIYPMDEELIKLCMVNQIQRLGLSEHFNEEIEKTLSEVYSNSNIQSMYEKQESLTTKVELVPAKIYKDALAFRLLRMQGYNVTPWTFCWFLLHEDVVAHIEENFEVFTSAMYNVYRATDLMFSGEYELEEARSFSKKLLEKSMTLTNINDNIIEHELSLPWIARLSHLDHRKWIEENKVHSLSIGKASLYRLSCLQNDKLMQLAVENYEFRQSIYRKELEELKRWSKEWGLSEMGFGREKTTYCYFAVAASSSLPHNSPVRMIVAKSAILITVADDFYDMEGSLNELEHLTDAVQRWDGKGLSGHSKIIFNALDHFVRDIAAKHLHLQGSDITKDLQDIWRETFVSWLTETTWSKSGYIPSLDEYLETGMKSIATHTIVLPALFFMSSTLSPKLLKPAQYKSITKLLMVMARLLNDIQSYQKEQEDGKMNLVLLNLKENPHADIESSITFVKEILDEKKKELLEHILMDGFNDLPKPCKHLHLSCLKVFQMFFNSSNQFDSNTDLLQDIMKAIYNPLEYQNPKPLKTLPSIQSRVSRPKKENLIIYSAPYDQSFKHHGSRSYSVRQHFVPKTISRNGCAKVFIPLKLSLCFI